MSRNMNQRKDPYEDFFAPATAGEHIDFDKTSTIAVIDALEAGGYGALVPRVAEVIRAARRGCLLWAARRLTTTDESHIDARPERSFYMPETWSHPADPDPSLAGR